MKRIQVIMLACTLMGAVVSTQAKTYPLTCKKL